MNYSISSYSNPGNNGINEVHHRRIGTVTVVCGPPGSGKTTYVNKHKQFGDLIVCLDSIYYAICGFGGHRKPRNLFKYAHLVKDTLLKELERDIDQRAWIITQGQRKTDRESFRTRFNSTIIVFEVPSQECFKRVLSSDDRDFSIQWEYLIHKWWKEYERDDRDNVLITY